MAQGFNAHLTYREEPGDEPQQYDLKVNHPLKIGGTEVFLIGHGYAPIITIRDGNGDVAYSGPTVFLPEDAGFRSFGVVKAPDAEPVGIGLEGLFFPTYLNVDGDPVNVMGDLKNPTLSMQAWTGDLGMDDGSPSSVYELDTAKATKVTKPDGSMFRVDLQPGQSLDLPDGAGSVTFEGVERWNKLQISRTPGTLPSGARCRSGTARPGLAFAAGLPCQHRPTLRPGPPRASTSPQRAVLSCSAWR